MRVAIIAAAALAAFLPSCEAACNQKGPWTELDDWARNIATGRDKIGEKDSIITNLPYGTPCEVIQAVENTLSDCSSQPSYEDFTKCMDDTLGIKPNQSIFLTRRVISNCKDNQLRTDTTCCNSLWTCLARCHEQEERCIPDQDQIPWPPRRPTGLVKTIDMAADVAEALSDCTTQHPTAPNVDEDGQHKRFVEIHQCVECTILGVSCPVNGNPVSESDREDEISGPDHYF